MSGDVMRQLAEARPAHLDPEADVHPETRSAELAHAMGTPRAGRKGRTRSAGRRLLRPMWGLGLVGAAAAAALVVATTATGPETVGANPGTAGPSPEASGTSGAVRKLDARKVLLAAAAGALRQPAAPGAYWHSRVQYGALEQVGPADNRYTVLHRYQADTWDPKSAKAEGWFRHEDLGAKPYSPADEAAWRADGSPTSWVLSAGGPDGKAGGPKLEMFPKDSAFAHSTGRAADAPDSLNLTQRELDRTPADPDALRRLILAHPLGEADDGENTDAELFETAAGLLMSRPLAPPKRAAIYRLLAEIKGVKALDGVRDATGRPGTALVMQQGPAEDGLSEIHFIVDRATGAGLAKEIRYLRGEGDKAWLKPGARWHYEVVTSEWVNRLPKMPRGPRGSSGSGGPAAVAPSPSAM